MALTDSLVSYWKFDESSGNAADSVGSNTLTNNNTATFTTGKINNATDLNGSSQSFGGTHIASLSLTGTMSISCWFYSDVDQGASLVSKLLSGGGTYNCYDLQVNISGTTRNIQLVQASSSNYGGYNGGTSTLFNNNAWVHVVLTRPTATTAKCYINGVEKTGSEWSVFRAVPTPADNSTKFYIGRRDGGNYFNGKIDEVGIWSRELTSAEVTSLYNSGNGLAYPFTTTSIKTISAVATASVKTINGVAIASVKTINGLA